MVVEELAQQEFAENYLRQEALQTIFHSLLDIFYHPIFDFLQKSGLFQQPLALSQVIDPVRSGLTPGRVTGQVKLTDT